MFTSPSKARLDANIALSLDDSFFLSRPFGYFSSRISSLLGSHPPDDAESGQIGREFASLLGQGTHRDLLSFNESDRELQVAIDAFALRHHAAESLVRLYHSLTVGTAAQGPVKCVWAAIAEGPTKTVDLVREAKEFLRSPTGHDTFWRVVFPEEVAAHPEMQRKADQALNVLGDWLTHAMSLLVRGDININAAHNKLKHGLAVRARNDVLATVTTQAPTPDGGVPLSSLTGEDAANILEGVTVEYLARPPRENQRKQGLEVTVLNLRPATLLAETWLMATAHAAMFHVAAARHFDEREADIQPFPTLPLGPTPEGLLGESVVGIRYPVTTPPDGGPTDRRPGIAFRTSFAHVEVPDEGPVPGVVVEG